MKSTGSWYSVIADGQVLQCRTKGKLRLKGFKTTNPIAVGDRVEFELESDNDRQGVISAIKPRSNYIMRKSVKLAAEGHVIAANIDQAMLIATLIHPRTSQGFIDRFTVTAESFRIPTIIIFNKCDALNDELLDLQGEVIAIYEEAGFQCLEISALQGEGLEEILLPAKDKVTLIAGHSGVGKSTLLNRLVPDANQKIGDVSEWSSKGVHTTTFAEMFQVDDNTFIIDTPGIKEFGLLDIEGFELADYFPEMRAIRGNCKFNNCTHLHEPNCAIIAAVEEGIVSPDRYESYLSMLMDEDNRR